MERPERIVLFMIGAFTNRMAAVMWVILILSIVTVANRIHYTYLVLNDKPIPPVRTSSRGCSGAPSSGATNARALPRPVGHRDPGVRVADASRLAPRSHCVRGSGLGVIPVGMDRTQTQPSPPEVCGT